MKNLVVEEMIKRGLPLNLQFFAEGEEGSDGEDAGGDDQGEEGSNEDGEEEEDEETFTKKDLEDAIKKRIARERRKWAREQKSKPSGKEEQESSDSKGDDNKDSEKDEKISDLELKWTALEHDIKRDCVDDVLALAKVHAAKKDLDIEDAIDDIAKKYPQFTEGYKAADEDEDDETKNKAWGQRQKGKGKKLSGVEEAFYAKHPELKVER